MTGFDLFLEQVQDPAARENFRKIIEFLSQNPAGQAAFKACELYVTANQTGLKIKHGLSSIPKDVITTRMVASSTARLVLNYADFTADEISIDVTGLAAGEKLHARLLVGNLESVVTFGEALSIESPTQQVRSKF